MEISALFLGSAVGNKLDRSDGSYLFHYNVIGAPFIDFTEKYGMSNLLNSLSGPIQIHKHFIPSFISISRADED